MTRRLEFLRPHLTPSEKDSLREHVRLLVDEADGEATPSAGDFVARRDGLGFGRVVVIDSNGDYHCDMIEDGWPGGVGVFYPTEFVKIAPRAFYEICRDFGFL